MRDWILLESLGRIKQGEFQRRNNSGIQAANEILVDGKIPFYDLNFMKGKIDDDAKRLYKMKVNLYINREFMIVKWKKEHANFFGKNFAPYEPDENISTVIKHSIFNLSMCYH